MSDRHVYKGQQRPQKHKKRTRRLLVLVGVLAVMLAAAWLITWWVQGRAQAAPGAVLPASEVLAQAASASAPPMSQPLVEDPLPLVVYRTPGLENGPAQAWMAEADNSRWNTLDIVPPAEARPGPLQPDYQMIALPANGLIDMAYFDTAVFVGDSLTQGMYIYSTGIPNAQYCAYKGISPKQIYDGSVHTNPRTGVQEVPIEAVAAYGPDNVYILLGTNAMVGMSNEILLAYYDELLNAMREKLGPDVGIYVQSITPVLQGVDQRFHFEDILYLNNELARMSLEKGMYFLNLHEALAGDDGWMRPDFGARDGYHLQPSGYTAWVDYLRTHTVYKARHAGLYLEQGDTYTQQPLPEG